MSETIIEIPLVDLHDSPTNPRKHYPEASLQELAEDIRQHGRVLQPLLVQMRGGRYRLIAGRKRLAAAVAAGLRETSGPQ